MKEEGTEVSVSWSHGDRQPNHPVSFGEKEGLGDVDKSLQVKRPVVSKTIVRVIVWVDCRGLLRLLPLLLYKINLP